MADSLRTDRRAFRRLSIDDPVVVELRYYPQMLELTNDLWADWLLELWASAGFEPLRILSM